MSPPATPVQVLRKLDDLSGGGGGDGDGDGGTALADASEAIEARFRTLFLVFGPALVFAADFAIMFRFLFTYVAG